MNSKSWVSSKFRHPFLILPLFILLSSLTSCGDIKIGSDLLGNKSDPNDLSTIALKPDSSWHDQYLVGGHSRFICADCHVSTARTNGFSPQLREIDGKLICNQCHSGEYARTDLFNHAQYKIGTYCNSCHFSYTFRQLARPSHDKFHHAISPDSNCVECHGNKNTDRHRNQGLSGSCQRCHKYPSWKGASFDHSVVTSGCADCHERHYGGSQCEWCHPFGVSWQFSHGAGDRRGCDLCHRGNYDD